MPFLPSNRFLFFLLMLLSGVRAVGQTASSSPYSRYGIGDIQSLGIYQTLGMGGIGIAVNSTTALNFSNPATFGRLQLTVFDAGVNTQFTRLQDETIDRTNNTASLGHFALAFPVISRKMGVGFGILPFSAVGYSLKDPQINSFGQDELHAYEGSGGLHQFFMSAGATLFKNFTFGANASVLFGDIVQDRRVEFSDPSFLNTRLTDTRSHRGFKFNFGLQYTIDSLRISRADSLTAIYRKISLLEDSIEKLDKSDGAIQRAAELNTEIKQLKASAGSVNDRRRRGDWSVTAGVTVSPTASLNASRSVVAETFRYLNASDRDQVIVKDTTYSSEGVKGNVELPLGFGIGLAMRKGTRWLIGTDLRVQNWSDYNSFGETDSLADSWRWSTGLQFVPDDRSFNTYWKQIQYMTGFHYSKTFLQLNGTQLEEMGVSAGIGLPIRRGLSNLRLMAEVGKRGSLDSGLLEERYVRFTLNFSLNDKWFIKQRYD